MRSSQMIGWTLLAGILLAGPSHAQLVVRDTPAPAVPNPATRVPYPNANQFTCRNTVADIGARAVLRAIDKCPQTAFESREAYLRYGAQAVAALAVPGLTEVALAQIADQARSDAFACLLGSLVEESIADDREKAFMNALIEEMKELGERRDLVGKLGELRTRLVEKGGAAFLADAEARAFALGLDKTVDERIKGLGTEAALADAGLALNDTAQARASAASEAARTLLRDCKFSEAESALGVAQQRNLELLAKFREQVVRAEKARYCLERDARAQPITALSPASPYLRNALSNADADILAAKNRDELLTREIQQTAELEQSAKARRGDLDILRKRSADALQRATTSAGSCDFAAAERELAAANLETADCAVALDAERQQRAQFVQQLGELRTQLAAVDSEYRKAIATPDSAISSCGEFSVFAATLDELKGDCRVQTGVDAKVAALRQRARTCADARQAPPTPPAALAISLSGTWNSSIGWVYQISHSGNTFSWTVGSGETAETAQGEILPDGRIRATWTNKNGSDSATGTVSADAQGRATRISWSNGVSFYRD